MHLPIDLQVLMKKIENLIKALEVESKKWKREASLKDKNLTSIKADEQKPVRNLNSSKRFVIICFNVFSYLYTNETFTELYTVGLVSGLQSVLKAHLNKV